MPLVGTILLWVWEEERVHLAGLAWLLGRATLLPVPVLLGPLACRTALGTRDLSAALTQGIVSRWSDPSLPACAWVVPACGTCSWLLSSLICFVVLDVQLYQNGVIALIRCIYLEITHFASLPTEVTEFNMPWLVPYLFSKCCPRHI